MMETVPYLGMFRIVAVFNILANTQERIDRLQLVLNDIPCHLGIRFSVRIRGLHQDAVFETKHNVRRYFGSTWGEWNLDLLQQVVDSPATLYLLLQEDHLLQMRPDQFGELLDQVIEHEIDYLPLSFYPQYEFFVNEIESKCRVSTLSILRYWRLDSASIRSIDRSLRNYPLNLIGVYTRDLLTRLLIKERPYYKKYSIEAPFNFERSPSETWFLPLNWGFPNSEVFACIDDDHGIPGYSLVSRGIQSEVSKRQVHHHDKGLVLGELPPGLSLFKQVFIEILPTELLVLPRNIKYSFQSLRRLRMRRKIQSRLLGES
jgi:hypothetical protein